MQASRIFAQHHVNRPTAATNQNLFAIHGKEPLAVVVEFGRDFTNAELSLGTVRGLSFNFEIQLQRIKFWLPHLRWPPQTWMIKIKLRNLGRIKLDIFLFMRSELYFLQKLRCIYLPFECSLYRLVRTVFQ